MPSIGDVGIGGGGKPKRIVILTSGTGTFTPLEDNSRCFVRVQAAGGGGLGGGGGGNAAGYSGGGSGSAGAMVEALLRIPIGGVPFSIGVGGLGGTGKIGQYQAATVSGAPGSFTRFGRIVALPGAGAIAGSGVNPIGGYANSYDGVGLVGIPGVTGGAGKATSAPSVAGGVGSTAGYPVFNLNFLAQSTGGAAITSGGGGGCGGGDSFFALGGNGSPGVATGSAAKGGNGSKGSGGGGGGAVTVATGGEKGGDGGDGGDGYIEVWEYGA